MKLAHQKQVHMTKRIRYVDCGSARIIVLALVSFLLGVGVTVLWFHRTTNNAATASVSGPANQPTAEQPLATGQTPAMPPAVVTPPPTDPAVIAEVKQLVTNYDSLSLEDGEKILSEEALKEFKEAGDRMNTAQQQLQQAQNGQSEAAQQAAMKNLQEVQTASAERLKNIAAHLQLQIAALKNLKQQQ
jgi:exonuclease VII small subunit